MTYNQFDLDAAVAKVTAPIDIDPDPETAYDHLHEQAMGLYETWQRMSGQTRGEAADVLAWLDRVLIVRQMLDEALRVQALGWATLVAHPEWHEAPKAVEAFERLTKSARVTITGLDVAVSGARWSIEAERTARG